MKEYHPRPEVINYMRQMLVGEGRTAESVLFVGRQKSGGERLFGEVERGNTAVGRKAYDLGCLLYDAQQAMNRGQPVTDAVRDVLLQYVGARKKPKADKPISS
jgi:hypothetical protein